MNKAVETMVRRESSYSTLIILFLSRKLCLETIHWDCPNKSITIYVLSAFYGSYEAVFRSLQTSKKFYKIPHHIESLDVCMEY
jgi:hypothetical protein